MSKKNRNRDKQKNGPAWHADIRPETKKGTLAIVAFMIATLLALSYIGKGGSVGNNAFRILEYVLGRGYFLAPLSFILIGFSLLFSEKKRILAASVIGGALFLFSSLSGVELLFGERTGGVIGYLLGSLFLRLFDFWASIVIVLGLLVISLLLTLNIPLVR